MPRCGDDGGDTAVAKDDEDNEDVDDDDAEKSDEDDNEHDDGSDDAESDERGSTPIDSAFEPECENSAVSSSPDSIAEADDT